VEPNVRESMSSVAVANTFPAFTMEAHCASASHGAWEDSHVLQGVSFVEKMVLLYCL